MDVLHQVVRDSETLADRWQHRTDKGFFKKEGEGAFHICMYMFKGEDREKAL